MQEQIDAIKQLLQINNAIAAVIESILIESIGENVSWELSSQIPELRDAVNWDDIESGDVSIPVLQQLWRSAKKPKSLKALNSKIFRLMTYLFSRNLLIPLTA